MGGNCWAEGGVAGVPFDASAERPTRNGRAFTKRACTASRLWRLMRRCRGLYLPELPVEWYRARAFTLTGTFTPLPAGPRPFPRCVSRNTRHPSLLWAAGKKGGSSDSCVASVDEFTKLCNSTYGKS